MSRRHAAGALCAVAAVVACMLAGCSSSGARVKALVTHAPGSASTPQPTTSRASASSTASTHPPGTPTPSSGVSAGTLLTRDIPGGSTGFHARPALVYLPPAARTHPHARFPVLVLLHGTDGGPTDWVMRGRAVQTLDAFAAAHDGRAPVVVMPDINGSVHDDTECVRTTRGADVERYLQLVVPAWIRAHLPVEGRAHWGIAGLSEGGTCALVLGLREYPAYSFVGDFSGLRRLTVGDTDDESATVKQLFGGSQAAYDDHDPTQLLMHHRYPELSVWFECGAADTTVVRDQAALARLAQPRVRAVHESTTPGRHHWTVWQVTLASALPWFWSHPG